MSDEKSAEKTDGLARVARLVSLKREELSPALISAAYFFFLLLCYYLLRPVRETFGLSRGYEKLPWLMTGTLIAMLLASPVFAVFASRVPRRVFIPWTYRFFAVNILAFWAMLMWMPATSRAGIGYAFYIWLSVFNLFVVSVFWAVLADVFGADRGKRAFAIAAVGGTLGAIAGSWLAQILSGGFSVAWLGQAGMSVFKVEAEWLMLLAIVPLECASQCVRLLRPWFEGTVSGGGTTGTTVGGTGRAAKAQLARSHEPTRDPLAGLKLIASSPFLATIGVFMLLFTAVGTLIYMEQGRIVEATFKDEAARTAAFAQIDLWTNVLTLATQLFLTGRILRWVGPRGALLILPVVFIAGFAGLWISSTYAVLAVFQIFRRGLHYAIDRPVRELLFAGLSADARYKAKTFIDTFVYRAGDMIGGWTQPAFKALGWAATIIAPVAVGVSIVWLGVAAVLGWLWMREQRRQDVKVTEGGAV